MSEMKNDIAQYQDSSQIITQKLFIFVGVIAYTVLILKIMTLPTKHALSPLFPGFTVPELDTSSRTDGIDPTKIQNIDVSMNEGENNLGFMVKQLEPDVEKHGNMELQIAAEMVEENHAETYAGTDDTLLLHNGIIVSNDSSMGNNTKYSAPKIQDMNQQPISDI
ncbi:hypothetical protein IHE45_05G104300 [Dioscorea alata]|uniref:Uncharacterized protein n=2 Tax=Dioscorea alata TaxID=55571 RepID=A0ACB7W3M0_DIOAL|nr:hypothetical protein IHE45_05G104300 [Dioscorea alata]KAH7682161.1 hypothetical protein IHE45_05G104300 [Dioscorea alata]